MTSYVGILNTTCDTGRRRTSTRTPSAISGCTRSNVAACSSSLVSVGNTASTLGLACATAYGASSTAGRRSRDRRRRQGRQGPGVNVRTIRQSSAVRLLVGCLGGHPRPTPRQIAGDLRRETATSTSTTPGTTSWSRAATTLPSLASRHSGSEKPQHRGTPPSARGSDRHGCRRVR